MPKKQRSTVQRLPNKGPRQTFDPNIPFDPNIHNDYNHTRVAGAALVLWLSKSNQLSILGNDDGEFKIHPNGEMVFIWEAANGRIEMPIPYLPDPTQKRMGALIRYQNDLELYFGFGPTIEDAYFDFCDKLVWICTQRFGVDTIFGVVMQFVEQGVEFDPRHLGDG